MTPLFLDHRLLSSPALAAFREQAFRSKGLVTAARKRMNRDAYEPPKKPLIVQRVQRGTCGEAYAKALALHEYEHAFQSQGDSALPWLVTDLLDTIARALDGLHTAAATDLQTVSGEAARRILIDEIKAIASTVEQVGYLLQPTIDVHGQIGAAARTWREDAIRRTEAVAKELRGRKITLADFRKKLPRCAATEINRLDGYLQQVRQVLRPSTPDPQPVDDELWQRTLHELLPM